MIRGNELSGRKISVIGAGVSGAALAELAVKAGAAVFISERKAVDASLAARFDSMGIAWESGGNSAAMLEADEIVVSSGVSPNVPILKRAVELGIPLVGELDFVFPYISGRIAAVTGSNGKTTTTSMLGYFMEKSGCSVFTGGNIGNPAAKAAEGEYDFSVFELSSFQLHWAKDFKCDAAIVTNLAPDHIDWHGSYENYAAAKAKAISSLRKGGVAVYQKRDEHRFDLSSRRAFPLTWEESGGNSVFMDKSRGCAVLVRDGVPVKLFDFGSLKLLGAHNKENAAMALAVLSLWGMNETPPEVISAYVPPRHRCAYAGEVNGITFVDDSKGTNVAASVTAMSSLAGSKVVILGGKGKGEEYAPLADAVARYAKSAVLLGSEKEKIAAALTAAGYSSFAAAETMEEAVRMAFAFAEKGDTVLLSPACTSWDMYPSYEARGDHFCKIAAELIERER